jgi:hypothetical protein
MEDAMPDHIVRLRSEQLAPLVQQVLDGRVKRLAISAGSSAASVADLPTSSLSWN